VNGSQHRIPTPHSLESPPPRFGLFGPEWTLEFCLLQVDIKSTDLTNVTSIDTSRLLATMNKDRVKLMELRAAKQTAKDAKAAKVNARKGATKEQDQVRLRSSKITPNLQQRCLNIIRDSLWGDDIAAFQETLQEVKGHLYNRDFARAFGSEHYLRAYAIRWSASRALGYLQVFEDINKFLLTQSRAASDGEPLKILGIGAGAGAELVSIAGWLNLNTSTATADAEKTTVDATLVDIAEWQPISDKLADAALAMPVLSKYASAAVRAASAPMVNKETFQAKCEQADVLEWDEETVAQQSSTSDLVTIMFTLNELYSASVPKTQTFLKNLTTSMHEGSLLLVVDSPGSYSTVSINGAEKKYPMQWLLDHTLLGAFPEDALWEKVLSDESKWFRVPEGLLYPIELENMRYQIHLYKRRSPQSG
jgi:25S rRNA (uracil2843-N3)-methyltransferase